MSDRSYFVISASLFTAVSISHLIRVVAGASISIDGAEFPLWASWLGFLVPGFLAINGFRRLTR